MGGIDVFRADFMHPVHHVQKVLFCVHADLFHAGKNFADDFLARVRVRAVAQTL